MTTPILLITELQNNQANQYAVANAAFRAIEESVNDFATVNLTSGNVTLTAAQLAADFFFRSSGNAVSRNLTVPAAKRFFAVHNNGSASLNVVCGSTTLALAVGAYSLYYTDGTANGIAAVGTGAAVGGGAQNVADGTYSGILSGYYALIRGIYGAQAHASGVFLSPGDAQRRRFVLRAATTNATATAATSTGGSAATTNQAILPNTSAFMFTARVVARSSADSAAYEITGLVTRGANAASTALVGAPTVTVIAESGGATAWDVAAVADATNGGLQIQVTGAASTNIKWVVDLETVEVVG